MDIGRYVCKSSEEWISQLCHWDMGSEETPCLYWAVRQRCNTSLEKALTHYVRRWNAKTNHASDCTCYDKRPRQLLDNNTTTTAYQQRTTGNACKPGRVVRNSWYDEECCNTRRRLKIRSNAGDLHMQTSKNNLPMPHEEEEVIVG